MPVIKNIANPDVLAISMHGLHYLQNNPSNYASSEHQAIRVGSEFIHMIFSMSILWELVSHSNKLIVQRIVQTNTGIPLNLPYAL